MFDDIDPLWIFYVALVGMVLALADTIYLLTSSATTYRKNVNRRLSELEKGEDRETTIIQLRRERGIGGLDSRLEVAAWFRRLITQSGVTMGVWRIAGTAASA